MPRALGMKIGLVPSFPDASNTGVQDGISLQNVPGDVTSGTGWYWTGSYVRIDGAGAVFENFAVNANVDVQANNVTIRNCQIVASGSQLWGVSIRHVAGTLIEHCKISGANSGASRLMCGIGYVYRDESGATVRYCDIHYVSTGVQIFNGTINDNYIHDMGFISGDHNNCVTSNLSTGQLDVIHNTLLCNLNQTDAMSLFQDFGNQRDCLVENNLLAGGSYTFYGGNNNTGTYGVTSNVKVKNNRFSRLYYPNGGANGYCAYYYKEGTGNEWSGNVWHETGLPVAAP